MRRLSVALSFSFYFNHETPMSSLNPKTYDTTSPMSVAFIGLGVMGFPMAGHLALAGHRVKVYNRNATKAQAFCEEFAAQNRAMRPPHAKPPKGPIWCFAALAMTTICAR